MKFIYLLFFFSSMHCYHYSKTRTASIFMYVYNIIIQETTNYISNEQFIYNKFNADKLLIYVFIVYLSIFICLYHFIIHILYIVFILYDRQYFNQKIYQINDNNKIQKRKYSYILMKKDTQKKITISIYC